MVDFRRLWFKTYTFLATAKVSVIERDVVNYVLNNGQVCYDEIGCFRNDETNLCKALTILPYEPEKIGAKFHLYTPEMANGTVPQIIDYFNPSNMTDLEINSSRPLSVVVHGFSQVYWYTYGRFLKPMQEALIEADNNVILVDWVAAADFPNYLQAASNLRVVGAMIGNVIDRMEKYNKSYLNTTTVIGYSLGCQTAGFAGKRLVQLGRPVKNIVALDPSRSLFADAPPSCRLDSGDATFVQVIHTNSGDSDVDANSIPDPIGHADFYANGGKIQDACINAASESKCSHDFSYIFYIESMRETREANGCKFFSFPCSNEEDWKNGECFRCSSNATRGGCPIVGYNADDTARGKFYFDTLPENETVGRYCGMQYILSMSSNVEVKGEIVLILESPETENATGRNTMIFQKMEETVKPNVIAERVIVSPYAITRKSRLSLLYRKYEEDGQTSGAEVWTIDNVFLKGPLQNETPSRRVLRKHLIRDKEAVALNLDDF